MFKRSEIVRKINGFLDFCMERFIVPLLLFVTMALIFAFVLGIIYWISNYCSAFTIITNVISFISLFGLAIVVIFGIIGLLRFIYLKIKEKFKY